MATFSSNIEKFLFSSILEPLSQALMEHKNVSVPASELAEWLKMSEASVIPVNVGPAVPPNMQSLLAGTGAAPRKRLTGDAPQCTRMVSKKGGAGQKERCVKKADDTGFCTLHRKQEEKANEKKKNANGTVPNINVVTAPVVPGSVKPLPSPQETSIRSKPSKINPKLICEVDTGIAFNPEDMTVAGVEVDGATSFRNLTPEEVAKAEALSLVVPGAPMKKITREVTIVENGKSKQVNILPFDGLKPLPPLAEIKLPHEQSNGTSNGSINGSMNGSSNGSINGSMNGHSYPSLPSLPAITPLSSK